MNYGFTADCERKGKNIQHWAWNSSNVIDINTLIVVFCCVDVLKIL